MDPSVTGSVQKHCALNCTYKRVNLGGVKELYLFNLDILCFWEQAQEQWCYTHGADQVSAISGLVNGNMCQKKCAEIFKLFFADPLERIERLAKQSQRYNQFQTYFTALGCHQGMNPVFHGLFLCSLLPSYKKVAQPVGDSSQAPLWRDPSWKTKMAAKITTQN